MKPSIEVPFLDGQTIVGVDGCRAGWLTVHHDESGLTYRIHQNIEDLMRAHPAPDIVFIDIPIGLPSAGNERRPCDVLARQALGARRASSVFSPPCRAAAHAASIEAARALNSAELGRSLSAQAWGICPKVAEVDDWMLNHPADRARLLEVHPEVCFWALNGQHPMRHRKSTRQGREERLVLLGRFEPGVRSLLDTVLAQTRRYEVEADDVLDAVVAMLTGSLPQGTLRSLEALPARDSQGLPMRMLFREADAG